MISFTVFIQICTLVIATSSGETVRFLSNGNAVYAVDAATGRPVWSDDGLLFRECYDPLFQDDEETDSTERIVPTSDGAGVPMLIRHGRLYVILEKRLENHAEINPNERPGPDEPSKVRDLDNVLVALDLRSQGKLVWRLDSTMVLRDDRVRWVGFRSLDGDLLGVETTVVKTAPDDEKPPVIFVDVASGTLVENRDNN